MVVPKHAWGPQCKFEEIDKTLVDERTFAVAFTFRAPVKREDRIRGMEKDTEFSMMWRCLICFVVTARDRQRLCRALCFSFLFSFLAGKGLAVLLLITCPVARLGSSTNETAAKWIMTRCFRNRIVKGPQVMLGGVSRMQCRSEEHKSATYPSRGHIWSLHPKDVERTALRTPFSKRTPLGPCPPVAEPRSPQHGSSGTDQHCVIDHRTPKKR